MSASSSSLSETINSVCTKLNVSPACRKMFVERAKLKEMGVEPVRYEKPPTYSDIPHKFDPSEPSWIELQNDEYELQLIDFYGYEDEYSPEEIDALRKKVLRYRHRGYGWWMDPSHYKF